MIKKIILTTIYFIFTKINYENAFNYPPCKKQLGKFG